jgi:antitoxin (DNA-binding transcriptional repressor) of toxin-antitoxin stability system
MIQVGVRQLRNGLTRYLRLAGQGQAVLVTSRKRPIAMIKRPDRTSAQTEEEIIVALVAEGKLLPAKHPGPVKPFKPVRVKGKPVSKMIIEDRR